MRRGGFPCSCNWKSFPVDRNAFTLLCLLSFSLSIGMGSSKKAWLSACSYLLRPSVWGERFVYLPLKLLFSAGCYEQLSCASICLLSLCDLLIRWPTGQSWLSISARRQEEPVPPLSSYLPLTSRAGLICESLADFAITRWPSALKASPADLMWPPQSLSSWLSKVYLLLNFLTVNRRSVGGLSCPFSLKCWFLFRQRYIPTSNPSLQGSSLPQRLCLCLSLAHGVRKPVSFLQPFSSWHHTPPVLNLFCSWPLGRAFSVLF